MSKVLVTTKKAFTFEMGKDKPIPVTLKNALCHTQPVMVYKAQEYLKGKEPHVAVIFMDTDEIPTAAVVRKSKKRILTSLVYVPVKDCVNYALVN